MRWTTATAWSRQEPHTKKTQAARGTSCKVSDKVRHLSPSGLSLRSCGKTSTPRFQARRTPDILSMCSLSTSYRTGCRHGVPQGYYCDLNRITGRRKAIQKSSSPACHHTHKDNDSTCVRHLRDNQGAHASQAQLLTKASGVLAAKLVLRSAPLRSVSWSTYRSMGPGWRGVAAARGVHTRTPTRRSATAHRTASIQRRHCKHSCPTAMS